MAAERIDPRDFPGEPISLDHYARYVFAGQFAHGKRVLDAACGLGYGASYLRAAGADTVLGVDLSDEAIITARERYGRDGLTFDIADVQQLGLFVPGPWDLITSFETIEHILNPAQFIAQCAKVLAPGGSLLCSVPNEVRDPIGENPFHLHHFDRDTFERLLRSTFGFVQIMPQTFVLASCIDAGNHVQAGPVSIGDAESATATDSTDAPECFIAVCGQESTAFVPRTSLVHARKLWDYMQTVEQGKHWLEAELSKWRQEAATVAADLKRQQEYNGELEKGKSWLESERSKWEAEAKQLSDDLERLREYAKELEETKALLESGKV